MGVPSALPDLVAPCLPADLDLAEICGGAESNFAQALRQCPRLNWQAYLAHNPDVQNAGMDPVEHFLGHGVYEGRSLYSWHPWREPRDPQRPPAPKVSVILSNYNNETFLEKCLESLLGQSLQEIEIIAVDDCSTDNSLQILEHFAAIDQRVQIIRHDLNKSAHMTRKTGVAAASGDYIMFVDSDDFYELNACETAWRAMQTGCDIATFNANFINHSIFGRHSLPEWTEKYNALAPGLYDRADMLRVAYMDELTPCLNWNKIFLRELAQRSWAQMEDGYYNLYEDMYEFIVIADNARQMLKIPDHLVNYSFGLGISTGGKAAASVRAPALHCAILLPARRYCQKRKLRRQYQYMEQFLFRSALKWVEQLDAQSAAPFFSGLAALFQPLYCARMLLREYHWRPLELARKLALLKGKSSANARLALLAIQERDLPLLRALAAALAEQDLNCLCLAACAADADACAADGIIAIAPAGAEWHELDQHLKSLANALTSAGIGRLVLLNPAPDPALWQCALARLCGVGLVNVEAEGIAGLLNSRAKMDEAGKLLPCFDLILCADVESEIYCRANGAKAFAVSDAPQQATCACAAREEDVPDEALIAFARACAAWLATPPPDAPAREEAEFLPQCQKLLRALAS